MSLKLHSRAGTIRIEPRPVDRADGDCDDSTLDLLLSSFAHRDCLTDGQASRRGAIQLIASRRLSWVAPANADGVLRANLAQLLDDLQAELDQLNGIAT
ncbi:MAG TPA: hypothetical protein VKH44_14565 [Pirellulaceae bacterium]|nr:hypothetical protein [Pirellulaceae bacterium]